MGIRQTAVAARRPLPVAGIAVALVAVIATVVGVGVVTSRDEGAAPAQITRRSEQAVSPIAYWQLDAAALTEAGYTGRLGGSTAPWTEVARDAGYTGRLGGVTASWAELAREAGYTGRLGGVTASWAELAREAGYTGRLGGSTG